MDGGKDGREERERKGREGRGKERKESFAKILAAVDDRRKIILLQRVKKSPKLFLEKWTWPPVNCIAV